MAESIRVLEEPMERDDVLAVGRLVLIAVVVGAVLASGGPAVAKLLMEGAMKWLGG